VTDSVYVPRITLSNVQDWAEVHLLGVRIIGTIDNAYADVAVIQFIPHDDVEIDWYIPEGIYAFGELPPDSILQPFGIDSESGSWQDLVEAMLEEKEIDILQLFYQGIITGEIPEPSIDILNMKRF